MCLTFDHWIMAGSAEKIAGSPGEEHEGEKLESADHGFISVDVFLSSPPSDGSGRFSVPPAASGTFSVPPTAGSGEYRAVCQPRISDSGGFRPVHRSPAADSGGFPPVRLSAFRASPPAEVDGLASAQAIASLKEISGEGSELDRAMTLMTVLGAIYHDIRGQLAVAMGNSQLFGEFLESLEARFQGSSADLETCRDMKAAMNDDLAAFYRIREMVRDAENMIRAKVETDLQIQPVSVRSIVSEIQKMRRQNPSHHISADQLDADVVHADRYHLFRMLENLVSNAAKYAPAQTRITISSFEENGDVVLQVSDEGPGIQGDPEKLFGLYQQGNTGKESTGTGMGLYYCWKVCKRHGGSIRAANRTDGKGAVFTIRLPKKPLK